MENLFYDKPNSIVKNFWLIPGIASAILFGWLIAGKGLGIGVLLIILPVIIGFLIAVFLYPKFGYISFIIYSFSWPLLARQFPGIQYGLGIDGILVLTWFGVIFYNNDKFRFRHINNDLVWLSVSWFILTVLEIGNPEKPSIVGWFYEMRALALYWLLSVPLAFLVFNKKSDLDLFLKLIILLSFIGALWGMKQLYIGLNQAEKNWLESGAKKTHLIFGKLRVFSYYVEAAQFGASQGQLAIMCLLLALGPYKYLRKAWYVFAGLIILYGMLISGTRGALFALVGGAFTFLVLSKQLKILLIGGIIGMGFLGMLKYTHIGNGNAEIVRLRSAVNPEDKSFQARMMNQAKLRDYLSSKPIGTGVGTIGMWGKKFNKDKYISSIPPDSLYVKIWAEYGIIGFIFWFGIMMYITGKSAGIIWNTKDPVLRNKLMVLCSGATGILFCSFGNEVLNQMPSSVIVYTSWVIIWLSPRWDKSLETKVEPEGIQNIEF